MHIRLIFPFQSPSRFQPFKVFYHQCRAHNDKKNKNFVTKTTREHSLHPQTGYKRPTIINVLQIEHFLFQIKSVKIHKYSVDTKTVSNYIRSKVDTKLFNLYFCLCIYSFCLFLENKQARNIRRI